MANVRVARSSEGRDESPQAVDPDATQPICIVTGAPVAPRPRLGPGRLGGYEVVERIARGGMGGVFLARELCGQGLVAIKMIDPELAMHPDIVARLRDELVVSRRARHPGLVEIFAFDRSEHGTPYLVMEYLDGENLGTLLEGGRLEQGAAAAIGAQVASAAAALHDVGVVHCDLKPDNLHVLYREGLCQWPATKILDFGVARMAGVELEDEPSIAGTPAYMAPEQWRGAAVPASDVYALGCVLYELITGAPPFAGTLPELMTAHFESLPLRPALRRPGLRPDLDRWICRMLAKDPSLRPRMAEVARGLSKVAQDLPSPYWEASSFPRALLAAA